MVYPADTYPLSTFPPEVYQERVYGTRLNVAALAAKLTGGGIWELNEANGNAIDQLGISTLTDTNTVASDVGKVYALARDFTLANSEFFTIADNANVSAADVDVTIEAWVKLKSVGGAAQMIVAKDVSGSREYMLTFRDDGGDRFNFTVFNAGGVPTQVNATNYFATFGAVLAGAWYHVLGWHDSVNNILGIAVNLVENVVSYSGGVHNGTAAFRIGARAFAGFENYANALIGPVRLYRAVLTQTEKSYLNKSGAGRSYPFL